MAASFTPEELARYRRHLVLKGFGSAKQELLKASRVLMIGAGGLGCPALLYLAAAGVGHITIVDPDNVDLTNLQRQVLYGSEDVGQPKAEAAARRLRALNPCVELRPLVARFCRDNALELCRSVDLVVDGSDNFGTRYLTNDACVMTGRPLVYGAIHQFEGQVSVFNHQGGPTYRCLFPEPPSADSIPNCAEAGVLGVLPGLIGTLQATEAIKLITGIGTPLSGRLLIVNALDMQTRSIRLKPVPQSREITGLPEDLPVQCAAGDTATPGAEDVTVGQARELLRGAQTVQVLDVREQEECDTEGMIRGAVHFPLGRIQKGETPPGLNPGAPLLVYCEGGVRSRKALPHLRAAGFTTLHNLLGGHRAWREAAAAVR